MERSKNPWMFFALVYALSTPFWILSLFTIDRGLPDNLPLTDIGAALTPTLAAAILYYKEQGWRGVRSLFARSIDFERVGNRSWIFIAVVLFPVLYIPTYIIIHYVGFPLPAPVLPPIGALGVLALFLVAAIAEELGYSAYATDALQQHMPALKTALIIGVFWALWHVPSMIKMGQPQTLIAWGLGATVAFRVLSVWLYNNSGRAASVVILSHAVGNTARTYFPGGRSAYESGNGAVSYGIIILFSILVVAIWGPKTLTGNTKVDR